MWTVPPTLYPCSSDMLSASAMIPCPANAASPWMRIGSARVRPVSPRRSCLARTRPCTTVFTHSRWLGLKASERWTLCSSGPSPKERSIEKPRWYLTSPPPSLRSVFSSSLSWNSAKICEAGFLRTLASTLSRPRCAIPMTISLTLERAARSTSRSSSGIRLSAPSSEKRFEPRNLFCRNCSNTSAPMTC